MTWVLRSCCTGLLHLSLYVALQGRYRKLSEAIAGLYLSKLPINTMGRGKTICALLAVKIPLDNRRTKGTQPGFFEKKQKSDLKVTAEGKSGTMQVWLGKGRISRRQPPWRRLK